MKGEEWDELFTNIGEGDVVAEEYPQSKFKSNFTGSGLSILNGFTFKNFMCWQCH